MTAPRTPRPIPDPSDLRLLSEIISAAGSVGLPQAAWRAGMSLTEAAGRLVTLSEAGMPLRLVAQGDPGLLAQIAARGPVPAHPVSTPDPAPTQASPVPAVPAPAPVPAVQAPAPAASMTPPSPMSTWGVPGSAAWTDRGAAPTDQAAVTPGAESASAESGGARPVPPPTDQAARSAHDAESAHADADPAVVPPADREPPIGAPQQATGLSGERVTVTVLEVLDPGNRVLTEAGYRLDPGERAVLVHSAVRNDGPGPHDTMPDLYLFLVDDTGATLPKAPVAVAGHPAHRVGVAPGLTVDGWTIFLIADAVRVAGVRWCVRPDLVDRSLTWSV